MAMIAKAMAERSGERLFSTEEEKRRSWYGLGGDPQNAHLLGSSSLISSTLPPMDTILHLPVNSKSSTFHSPE
jgi:hypothetical protein